MASMLSKRFVHSLRDVVIVGGGPAGLSILTALKNSSKTKHLKCTLIEGSKLAPIKQFNLPNYTNRVISLTSKSVDFMQKIGSWNHIDHARVKFYDGLYVVDSQDPLAKIEFTNEAIDYRPMAAMCEIINVQKSLLLRLDELNQQGAEAEILQETKVATIKPSEADLEIDWPIIQLENGDTIQSRLLIGADGYNSPVRKYSGIQSRGWQYNSFGIVGTLKLTNENFNSLGYQRFLSTGPLAILPLTENNATFVWSTKDWLSKILIKVDEELMPTLINAALRLEEVDLNYIYKKLQADPNDKSVINDIQWSLEEQQKRVINHNKNASMFSADAISELPEVTTILAGSRAMFPLKMSHADTYVGPRVALVGDAAHTIHPLAGQGLNMGQSDVSSLIAAIERGVDRGLDIGSTLVLEPYVLRSWPFNQALLTACDSLHKVFATDSMPVVLIRGLGMKVFDRLGPIKNLLVKSLSL